MIETNQEKIEKILYTYLTFAALFALYTLILLLFSSFLNISPEITNSFKAAYSASIALVFHIIIFLDIIISSPQPHDLITKALYIYFIFTTLFAFSTLVISLFSLSYEIKIINILGTANIVSIYFIFFIATLYFITTPIIKA